MKRQLISGDLARELILRFKNYEGEPITIEEIKKIVGPKVDSKVHRGLDDIGRNLWILSDEDNTSRNDRRLRIGDSIDDENNKKGSD
jgi:hypothetical protein